MNYRDFYKNNNSNWKKYLHLLPEGVDPKEFEKGFKDEFGEHPQAGPMGAAKIASQHLAQNSKYYTKLNKAGLEEKELLKGMKLDDGCCDDGLPKRPDGSLDIEHDGRPIHLSKIVQIGRGFGNGSANGEISGYTAIDRGGESDEGGVDADVEGDKEPITAGGKTVDPGIASKSVGDKVVPGAGQKQGGPNTKGCIAGTQKMEDSNDDSGGVTLDLQEAKTKLRKMVKDVLKEIVFNEESGKWVRIDEGGHKKGCTCGFCKNKGAFGKKAKDGKKEDKKKDKKKDIEKNEVDENVDMKMGPSYKVSGPQYRTADDDQARTVQFEPEITEMCDEEECGMQERYTELATIKRNLSETELSELKDLGLKLEKKDKLTEKVMSYAPFRKGNNVWHYDWRGFRISGEPNKLDRQRSAPIIPIEPEKGDPNKFRSIWKTENVNDTKRNFGASQGGTEPNVYDEGSDVIKFKKRIEKNCRYCKRPLKLAVGGSQKAACSSCGTPVEDDQLQSGGFPVDEAGGAAVQHKSFRTVKDNPQIVKNRHKGDVDENNKFISPRMLNKREKSRKQWLKNKNVSDKPVVRPGTTGTPMYKAGTPL